MWSIGPLPTPLCHSYSFLISRACHGPFRLSKDAWQESLPATPHVATSGQQDYSQLYLKLVATQRQLIRARHTNRQKDETLVGMQVSAPKQGP